jgi:hypothetical protein
MPKLAFTNEAKLQSRGKPAECFFEGVLMLPICVDKSLMEIRQPVLIKSS